MESNKSIVKSLFNSIARILCISLLFIVFGVITYRIPKSLNMLDGLSIFAMQFYASVLQVIAIFFIFKYGFKKKNAILKEDEKRLKINLFDILIFLFIGFLLKSISYKGLFYLENITNTGPKRYGELMQGVLEGMQITNLDKIYSFITGVILVPIVEELFFRKGVFEYFAGKDLRSRTVILISGISFGLTHSMGPAIMVHAIITGIIFAVIYAITENVIYPVIGHGLNNAMSGITSIFKNYSGIDDVEFYIGAGRIIEIKVVIMTSLALLIITSIISYIKRKTIISSDFKERFIKVFIE